MRRTLAGLGAALVAGLTLGCGAITSQIGGATGVEVKDYVSEAEKHVSALKSDYVLMMGVYDLIEQKLDEFAYIPDGLKLAQVKWKDFEKDLTSCWEAPIEAAEAIKEDTVDALEAAKAYKNASAYREIKAVQVTGTNAINRVKACPTMVTDEVKGFPKKGMDEAKAWARDRVKILNDMRVLLKDELGRRAKALSGRALDTPAEVMKIVKQAEAEGLVLAKNPMATAENKQRHQQQLDTLKRMEAETRGLAETMQKDAMGMPERVANTGTRVATNITTVGRQPKKGR